MKKKVQHIDPCERCKSTIAFCEHEADRDLKTTGCKDVAWYLHLARKAAFRGIAEPASYGFFDFMLKGANSPGYLKADIHEKRGYMDVLVPKMSPDDPVGSYKTTLPPGMGLLPRKLYHRYLDKYEKATGITIPDRDKLGLVPFEEVFEYYINDDGEITDYHEREY